MSKDIWHTSNEKPEQLRYYLEEYDKFSDGVGYLVNKRYGVVNTIDDLTTKRWCYLDDLLALETELERTRKALKIALDAIDKGEAALIGCQEADDKYISDVTAEDGLELMSQAYKQIKELDNE